MEPRLNGCQLAFIMTSTIPFCFHHEFMIFVTRKIEILRLPSSGAYLTTNRRTNFWCHVRRAWRIV